MTANSDTLFFLWHPASRLRSIRRRAVESRKVAGLDELQLRIFSELRPCDGWQQLNQQVMPSTNLA